MSRAGSETVQNVAKIAKLEAQVESLRVDDERLRAEFKEFREAVEGKSKRSADTFWKIVAAVLALATIISSVITAVVTAKIAS